MSTRIGQLRHRLTIEQAARTDDSGGGATLVWNTVAEVWGAVEALSGKESVEADRTSGSAIYSVTIRYRDGLEPSMRFRRDNEIYQITSVLDEDGRRRFLTCKCERRDL
ncbi:MAG TPA: phage head closure protein [Hyphomicrobiales bacterium]|nr:phage head closure protein [Hyphomicrobiales bacterium]